MVKWGLIADTSTSAYGHFYFRYVFTKSFEIPSRSIKKILLAFTLIFTCFIKLGMGYRGFIARKISAGIYPLKVNNRNTRARCEICSKLTIKTPERRTPCSSAFIVTV